eukprot:m.339719 g.339719  ORF g.339719 m.339719 type:complete len:391 (-) comp18930_c0_seq1:252-1424(-)
MSMCRINPVLYQLLTLSLWMSHSLALEDCKCKPVWEMNCVDGTSADMKGCPEYETLARCNPPQDQLRWCETTEKLCNQQTGNQVGHQNVTYCNLLANEKERETRKEALKGAWMLEDWCKLVVKELADDGVTQKNFQYDLTPLSLTKGTDLEDNYKVPVYKKAGYDDYDYFINICQPLLGFDGETAAYQWIKKGAGNYTSKTVARMQGATLSSLHEGVYGKNLMMRMTGGDHCSNGDIRTTLIVFICADVGLGEPMFIDELNHCEYTFVWMSCAACELNHAFRNRNCPNTRLPGQLLPGSTIFIVVIVAIAFVYVSTGLAWNRAKGKRGMEQIPHYKFWGACCGYALAGPGAICSICRKKPEANAFSVQMHTGLVNEGSDVDDDAEDQLYS